MTDLKTHIENRAMKLRKIKARRMWAIKSHLYNKKCDIQTVTNNWMAFTTPVAMLDVSDEDALVEQVAQFDLEDAGAALANDGLLGLLKKTPIEHAREYSRALLESLGIISKRRAKQ